MDSATDGERLKLGLWLAGSLVRWPPNSLYSRYTTSQGEVCVCVECVCWMRYGVAVLDVEQVCALFDAFKLAGLAIIDTTLGFGCLCL